MRQVVEDWSVYRDFAKHEFDHGGPAMIKSFMDRLQTAREIARILCRDLGIQEVRFIINSGSRSVERNRQVGGTPDSTHLYGCACDIRARTSRERFIIVKSLLLAGFTRIKVGDGYVHVDEGEHLTEIDKDPYVIWR